ncbi:hypothetical protein [Eubacterium ventriosum]|jgi:hypothetical protein|uniref:hypothetical protein n=1 Tax=Eubacterium ventriosum TaxID=39496 RepID=UPI003992E697
MKKRKVLVLAMCIVMIFSTVTVSNVTNVEAKATKKALKYLKGTWHTWNMPGYKVKFTKKYVKYYADYDSNFNQLPSKKIGKLEFKNKIVSTKKKKGKWTIKVKKGKGSYYYFKTSANDKNVLEYWGKLKDSNTYSGSSSLEKWK